MASAKHKRHGRLAHSGDKLGYCKPRLNVAADGIKNNNKSLDFFILFDGYKLGYYVLVLGCFCLGRKSIMPLDLADNCKTMNYTAF